MRTVTAMPTTTASGQPQMANNWLNAKMYTARHLLSVAYLMLGHRLASTIRLPLAPMFLIRCPNTCSYIQLTQILEAGTQDIGS